jgi:uncharacterized protein YkwD
MRIASNAVALLLLGCAIVSTAPAGMAEESPSVAVGKQVNAYRRAEGHTAQRRNAKADAAAEAHASDMAQNGFFAHRGSDGSSVGVRLRAAGCSFTAAGENIAKGWKSSDEVVAAWIASPGHQRNMLGMFRQYGVAQAGDVWVLVFASGC